jgi:hypothetical protein
MTDDRIRALLAKGRTAPAAVQHEDETGARRPRSAILVDGILAKAEADGVIVPGARADLAKLAATLGGPPHEKAAQIVALLLAAPEGKRYRNADRQPDPAVAGGSLLRRVVALLPLRDGRTERAILDAFALKANAAGDVDAIVAMGRELAERDGKPFDAEAAAARAPITATRRVAELVIEYLEEPDGAESWDRSVRPKLTEGQSRAVWFLDEFRRLGYLSSDADTETLARKFSGYVVSPDIATALREVFHAIGRERGAAGPADRATFDAQAWAIAIEDGATYNGPEAPTEPPPAPRAGTPPVRGMGSGAGRGNATGSALSRDAMRAYLKATGTGGF